MNFKNNSEDTPETPPEKIGGSPAIEKRLLDERKIFLWGVVDDASAKHVIDRLFYLELENPGKEITLYINSPGGMVTSGFAIYDVMKAITSPVSTVCMGLAASMGSILLSAGAKGRRFSYPYARVMIHQPSGGAQGTSADIEIATREILKIKELGARVLAENCNQSYERVMKDMNRDYWMNSEESVAYGIIDGVMTTI